MFLGQEGLSYPDAMTKLDPMNKICLDQNTRRFRSLNSKYRALSAMLAQNTATLQRVLETQNQILEKLEVNRIYIYELLEYYALSTISERF